jgi:lysophospholipase L1-like esterase
MHKRISTIMVACLAAVSVSCIVCAHKTNAKADAAVDSTKWFDCKDIGVEGKGWTDTKAVYDRLPAKAEDKVPGGVWELSRQSAGLCVRFTTDAASIQVRWTLTSGNLAMPHMPATGVSGVDLYMKDGKGRWSFVANGRPNGITNAALFTVQPNTPCLLYLPLYNGVKSVEIGVPEGKTVSAVKADANPRKSIVFYGTSINQGGCASRPGLAFMSILGRRLDVPVVNLGFSGSGKMEPVMADLLAELDPSVFVIDCCWNMTPQLILERAEPLVRKLRAAHPNTPILLAEDYNFRNESPTEKGQALRKTIDKLKAEGMKNLYFLPAKDMLGTDGEGTVDGCHPNDLGMMRLADGFAKALEPMVQKAAK